jgi:hypothetical protein
MNSMTSTNVRKLAAAFLVIFMSAGLAFAADPWPASSTATNIGSGIKALNANFEASGLDWHPIYKWITVGDEGEVATLDGTGTVTYYYTPGKYGFEGVAIADSSSSLVYFADENSYAILEFDLSTGALTGKTWTLDLPRDPDTSSGLGFEALAFVPAADAPSTWKTPGAISSSTSGFFVAGSQYTNYLYIYAISGSSTGSVSSVATFYTPYTDVSSLDYNEDTKLLYVVHDSQNKMKAYHPYDDVTPVSSYTLPSAAEEEGLSLQTNCSAGTANIAITDDTIDGSPDVDMYTSYPITCDQDDDGVFTPTDCDDTNASLSTAQTFYEDADGDGLGNPAKSGSFCATGAPAGYVSNTKDTNDSIPNAGVEISADGVDNDEDGTVDEVNTLAANGPHPHYSTLKMMLDPRIKNISKVEYKKASGELWVTYKDNSIYAYTVFTGPLIVGKTGTISYLLASARATVSVSLGLSSVSKSINLYTGALL